MAEQKNEEHKVNDCLVFSIGIKKYDKFKDLEKVDEDIEKYSKILQLKYGFNHIKNETNERMTKKELNKQIKSSLKFLYEENDDGDIILLKKGLICTISSYGDYSGILLSDNTTCTFNEILRKFCVEEELNMIPKIFLVDVFEENYNYDNKKDDYSEAKVPVSKKFQSIIIAKSAHNANGQIASSMLYHLDKNYNMNMNDNDEKENKDVNWLSFGKILELVKKDIKNLVLKEHNKYINNVIFWKPKRGRNRQNKPKKEAIAQVEPVKSFLLENCAGLDKYYPFFSSNGYETMNAVKKIDENILKKIGIKSSIDIKLILKQVKKLQQ
eukprot:544836_1